MHLNLTYSFTIPALTILLFIISMYFLFNKQSGENLLAKLTPEKFKSLKNYKHAPFALTFFALAILPISAAYIFDSLYAYNQALLPVIIFMTLNDFCVELIKEVRASI